ncbi:hypothetical protein GIB67_027241 [Kingdonia uniflora]|uniref:Retrotransposon Copia-like N-terminal domain-containing protein n=1 Tax=Kingdonia uniflora TaxID=39325 RepID=A0A7J7KYF5_9MAGN|nr:hypothetical protein GIB67_027241 [Kingdonia uniflora]
MAIDDESSSNSTVSSIRTSEDVQSFNCVHDNPNLKITSQLLDGLNYVRWVQSVKLFVGGCGKIRFLLGTEKEPTKSNPKYAKWFSNDLMVRTWLINYMQPTISAGYLFTNNAHLIWESLRKVYFQRENNAKIFLLSNEIRNFKQASAPSEKAHIPPTVAEIYAKIVEKTRVFQFLAGLNPDFEYARVHLLNRTHFPTLEEAYTYCLSDQSGRSPMPPISGIPSETSAMAVRYAYPAPSSVPSQTSHTSSPSLSPLLAALVSPVYTRRDPRRQSPTLDYQASSVASGLPPAIDSPLSGIEPSTASIPVTIDDDSPVSHSDDDRPIAIRKEKRNINVYLLLIELF